MLFISIAAAIVSAIASYLVHDKYSSSVILFPVKTNSISKALLSGRDDAKSDILEFGEEEQVEQLLQILQSDEIRNRIIDKYQLMDHYGIDKSGRFPYTRLYEEFEGNILFERTEFMSVRIEVLDEKPGMAADIANDIAALSDSVRHRIHSDRVKDAFAIIEKEYLAKQREVKSLEDTITWLRSLGVYDFQTQTEVLTEQRAQALIEGKKEVAKEIDETFKLLAKYGAQQVAVSDKLYKEYQRLGALKEKYEQVKVDMEESLPYKFVVNKAVPAEHKKYPIRWLIVLVSTFSTFLLSVLTISIIEKWRKLRIRHAK